MHCDQELSGNRVNWGCSTKRRLKLASGAYLRAESGLHDTVSLPVADGWGSGAHGEEETTVSCLQTPCQDVEQLKVYTAS